MTSTVFLRDSTTIGAKEKVLELVTDVVCTYFRSNRGMLELFFSTVFLNDWPMDWRQSMAVSLLVPEISLTQCRKAESRSLVSKRLRNAAREHLTVGQVYPLCNSANFTGKTSKFA
ncbi:hypothetical protein UY3_06114 [Chelonia mydas]|uniref:Uncharacterized protein n=1 Tax=Chelonia mydas TaxID=8469 RepID=M7BHP4_CHEMY|nr:hypothetical protein UY3_06114 [Chelonia mydas]